MCISLDSPNELFRDTSLPPTPRKRKKQMDIKHGRRKSFDIEYVDVTEGNISEVAKWCGGVIGGEGRERWIRIIDKNAMNVRQTKAFVDDIVIHHLELDSFKAFGRKAFYKSFEQTNGLTDTEREADRNAKDGKYVTHEYAEENPDTTVHETVHAHDADPS